MKRAISLMTMLGVAACGTSQSAAVGPIVAQNPTLSYLEYINTTAVNRTEQAKAVDMSGYIAIAIRMADRCDHLAFNPHSKPLMKDKINRALFLQGGKSAIAKSTAKAEAEYKNTYGVDFTSDATSSTCTVADKEFAKQTIPTAFLWDLRMKPET